MAVDGIVGAKYMISQLGQPYSKMDCIRAAVVNVIRNCPGGDANYRCGGCTELWNSLNASGKYRFVTRRMTLSEAMAEGMMIGDLPVIYDERTGTCEHIAYYMGGVGGYEVIHSSASKGLVCETKLENGFTHVLRHKLIAGVYVNGNGGGNNEESGGSTVEETLYRARVATQGGHLNLRSSAKKADNILMEIPYGAIVDVLDDSNREWIKIAYNGTVGYASSDYLKHAADEAPSPSPDPIPNPVPDEPDVPDGGEFSVTIPCASKQEANAIVRALRKSAVVASESKFHWFW